MHSLRLVWRRISCAFVITVVSVGCATKADDTGVDAIRERIEAAMQSLGASEARSACFSARVVEGLPEDAMEEAARVPEGALSGEEMRSNVLSSSAAVRRGYTAAGLRCALVR